MSQELKTPEREIQYFSVSEICFLEGNPNTMTDAQFEALKQDMEKHGPYGIDPIEIAKLDDPIEKPKLDFPSYRESEAFYVCANGNHRLKAAKKLKWKHIRAIINKEIKSEEDLIILNYTKNTERGQMDEISEAKVFKKLVDSGWTQGKIAKELNIGDRSQVAKRLSLLKIEPRVLTQLSSNEKISSSHLEIIAPLEPVLQEWVAEQIQGDSPWKSKITEKDVAQYAKDAKDWKDEHGKLLKAVEKSKFKECPTCKRSPDEIPYEGLPWARCAKYHEWNLNTGNIQEKLNKSTHGPVKNPEVDQFIRSTLSVEDYTSLFLRMLKPAVQHIEEIYEFRATGKAKDGGRFTARITTSSAGAYIQLKDGKKDPIELAVEEKKYAKEELKDIQSIFRPIGKGFKTEQAAAEFSKEVEDLFKEYFNDNEKSFTKEEKESLKKLKERLESGHNLSQLAAVNKLEVLAGV